MRTAVFFIVVAIAMTSFGPAARSQDIIFEENFDDGVADGFEPDSPLWHVNDSGQYEIEHWGYGIRSSSYFGQYLWNDFHLSLDLLIQGSVHSIIDFRIQENDNMYTFILRDKPYRDVFLFKVIDGVRHQLKSAEFSSTIPSQHHIELIAQKNHFRFMVDDELALEHTDQDSPFLSGRQALISFTGGVAQHQLLQVDNIKVVSTIVSPETTAEDQ